MHTYFKTYFECNSWNITIWGVIQSETNSLSMRRAILRSSASLLSSYNKLKKFLLFLWTISMLDDSNF